MKGNPSPARVLAALTFAAGTGWFAACATAPRPAWSRTWKPEAADLARDYSIITDTRGRDVKMVFWLTPPMVPAGSSRQLLEDYIVVGVVRGHISAPGTLTFDTVSTLQAADGNAVPLRLLGADEIPPAVNGAVTTMASMFSQGLGAFGKGFQWFVFETGSVHACAEGGLSIPFADEVFTYETPIPGCPAQ